MFSVMPVFPVLVRIHVPLPAVCLPAGPGCRPCPYWLHSYLCVPVPGHARFRRVLIMACLNKVDCSTKPASLPPESYNMCTRVVASLAKEAGLSEHHQVSSQHQSLWYKYL